MKADKDTYPSRLTTLLWALFNMVGGLLLIPAFYCALCFTFLILLPLLEEMLFPPFPSLVPLSLLTGGFYGLAMSAVQISVLPPQRQRPWILTNICLGAVASLLTFFIFFELERGPYKSSFPLPMGMDVRGLVWTDAVVGSLGGLLVGIGQWIILRQQRPYASLWLFATPVGWALFFVLLGYAFEEIKRGFTP